MQTNLKENLSFFGRLKQVIDFYGFKSLNDFAKNGLNYSSPEKLNRLKDDKNKPSIDIITDLSNKFDNLSIDWLVTGRGVMLKGESPTVITGIPLVTIRAVGGFGNSNFAIGERDVKDYYVIPKFKHKQIDFMIEVEGSSMYPKYNSGDVVACRIIKESGFVQWNKTHVIATKEQGILIKRIRLGKDDSTLLMVSDNKDYPEFEVPKKEIDGIALVVGVIRLE